MISTIRDAIAVGALSVVGYGCWQIYPPSAWIVIGLAILAGVIFGGRGKHDPRQTIRD